MNHDRPSPLPSHPLLSSSSTTHPQVLQSNNAFETLAAMLLGPSKSSSRNQLKQDVSTSGLLARRQKSNGLAEVVPLGLDFLNPNTRSTSNLRKRIKTVRNQDRIEEEFEVEDELLDIPSIPSIPFRRRLVDPKLVDLTNSLEDEEFDLPPSPTIFPGGWNDDNRSLKLPAPFLDSTSSRDSFEGLLGTRQVRETSARIRRLEKALSKDRPPPPAFPQSLIATASKLINSLGPPGGVDSGLLYRKWQDQDEELQGLSSSARKDKRRLDTAERGLKGLEVGQRTARRWAEKLRKESRGIKNVSRVKGVSDILKMEPLPPDPTIARAATPLSLFDDIGALSGYVSPPLPSYSPMAYHLDPSSIYLNSSPPQTSLDFLPPKPILAPIFTDNFGEPSPFPLPILHPTRDISDNGYFDARKEPNLIPLSSEENFPPFDDTSSSLLDNATTSASPSASFNPSSIISSPLFLPLSPIKEAAKIISTAGEPLTLAFDKISSFAKNNLEFMVWILVGSSTPQIFQMPGIEGENVAGLFGALMHLFGFTFFLLVHSFALIVSSYATLRSIILFSHWTYLNLTGRTDLSIVAKEYLSFCRVEWNKVSESDGTRLGVWAVVIGFMEMAAVQAMTREQWISEGPGNLKLLNGEDELDFKNEDGKEELHFRKVSEDVNEPNSASPTRRNSYNTSERVGLSRRKSTRAWTTDDREAESLVVTGGEDSILEGTIINESYNPLSHLSPIISASGAVYEELPPLDIDDLPGGFSPIYTQSPLPASFVQDPPFSPPLRPLPEQNPLFAILKTIKRCVRLSTASYGLHSYVLAPPTPLFTPSGNSIAQHIFSHLGGVEAKNVLHVAIQKDYLGVPSNSTTTEAEYEPQFYLLRDDLNSEIVCVIRGTQSLHDVRIDLEATEVNLELPSLVPGGDNEVYRCHGGILAAARRLLNPELSALFPKLRTVMQEHENYSLVLTGHSLGSAIASTIAILVSQYDEGTWKIHSNSGLPVGRSCRAICFAPPAIFETRLASRCALGKEALILSVSLSCDVVVRMGIPQVREVRRALGRLQKKRDGMAILTSWWRWKRAGGGEILENEGEEKSELVKSIEKEAWEWRKEMDYFGVEAVDDQEMENDGLMIPAGRALHLDRLPANLELKRKKEMEKVMDDAEDDDDPPGIFGLYEVQNPALFFRCPHLTADLIQVHLPRFYLDSIESL